MLHRKKRRRRKIPNLESIVSQSVGGDLSDQVLLFSDNNGPKKTNGDPAQIGDSVDDWLTPTGETFSLMTGGAATLEWSTVVPGLKVVKKTAGGWIGNNYGALSGTGIGYFFLGYVPRDTKYQFIPLIGHQDAELPTHSTIGKGLWMRSNWTAEGFSGATDSRTFLGTANASQSVLPVRNQFGGPGHLHCHLVYFDGTNATWYDGNFSAATTSSWSLTSGRTEEVVVGAVKYNGSTYQFGNTTTEIAACGIIQGLSSPEELTSAVNKRVFSSNVIGFGDSRTRGLNWAGTMQEVNLRGAHVYVNAGDGEGVSDCSGRISGSAGYYYDSALVLIGVNDTSLTGQQKYDGIFPALSTAVSNGDIGHVYICNEIPDNLYDAGQKSAHKDYRDLIESGFGAVSWATVIDSWRALQDPSDEDVLLAANTIDGRHLSETGYDLLMGVVSEAMY